MTVNPHADHYDEPMPSDVFTPSTHPDLPARMTWEELELLPKEIAGEIELWNGHVVWVRRAPREHQQCTGLFWRELLKQWRESAPSRPESCYQVSFECNVFLGASGKSDFLTPDFLVHRCIGEFSDIRGSDVALVGEVLFGSNRKPDIEARKARYARAGIQWYWEVSLARNPARVDSVRAYALETGHGQLPDGVEPLHPANYVVTNEWSPTDSDAIETIHPFPIRIEWSALAL